MYLHRQRYVSCALLTRQVHVPQTQEAKAEALELMSVVHNLATPKSGELLVSATQVARQPDGYPSLTL